MPLGRCTKKLQIQMPIAIGMETRVAVVSALNDVKRNAGQV